MTKDEQYEAAEVFHNLGVDAARAAINLMHVPNESTFAATNMASGMINECAKYIMAAAGSEAIVAILDSISQQALVSNRPGAEPGVKVAVVNVKGKPRG